MRKKNKRKWFKLIIDGLVRLLYAVGFLIIAIAKLIDSLNH